MEEATLVDFNQHRGGQPKLVAIYPSEGTFFSDNPYIALKAPWVTADQKAGAASFGEYLADNIDALEGGEVRLPPGRPEGQARGAADGRQRRRPRRSPSACSACPSRACSPR